MESMRRRGGGRQRDGRQMWTDDKGRMRRGGGRRKERRKAGRKGRGVTGKEEVRLT